MAKQDSSELLSGSKTIIDAFIGVIVYTGKILIYFTNDDGILKFKIKKELDFPIKHVAYFPTVKLLTVTVNNGIYCHSVILDSKLQSSGWHFMEDIPSNDWSAIYSRDDEIFMYVIQENEKTIRLKILKNHNRVTYNDGLRFWSLTKSLNPIFHSGLLNFDDESRWKMKYTDTYKRGRYDNTMEKKNQQLKAFMDSIPLTTICTFTANYIVYSVFDTLSSLCLNSAVTKSIVLPSMIATITKIDENSVLVTTTDYGVYVVDLMKLTANSILKSPLSICVEDVSITKSFFFLSNTHTGLVIINRSDGRISYMRSKHHVLTGEINLFLGISYAINLPNQDIVLSYTDGFNSIISKKTPNINIELKFHSIKPGGATLLLGYIDQNNFIVRDEISYRFYFNGVTEIKHDNFLTPDLLAIIPNYLICKNQCKKGSFDYISGDSIVFEQTAKSKSAIGCFVNSKYISICYLSEARKVLFLCGQSQKSFVKLSSKISYHPTSIKILKVSNKNIDFIMFDFSNISFHRYKIGTEKITVYKKIKWNKDEQIVDVLPADTVKSKMVFICTLSGGIWQIDIETYEVKKFSTELSLHKLYLLRDQLLAITTDNNIYILDYQKTGTNKFLFNSNGGYLTSRHLIEDDLILISTTHGTYGVKLQKFTRSYEAPIRGTVRGISKYDDETSLIFTNKGLYIICNTSLQIQTSLLVDNIYDVNYDFSINTIMISINDNKNAGWIVLAKYNKKDGRLDICDTFPTGVLAPAQLDKSSARIFVPVDHAKHGGNCVESKSLNFGYDKTEITLLEPIKCDVQFNEAWNCMLHVSLLNNLLMTSTIDGSVVNRIKGVDAIFPIDDGNLLLQQNCALIVLERETHSMHHLMDFNPHSKITWIDTSRISLNERHEIVKKSGRFMFTISKDFVFTEYRLEV